MRNATLSVENGAYDVDYVFETPNYCFTCKVSSNGEWGACDASHGGTLDGALDGVEGDFFKARKRGFAQIARLARRSAKRCRAVSKKIVEPNKTNKYFRFLYDDDDDYGDAIYAILLFDYDNFEAQVCTKMISNARAIDKWEKSVPPSSAKKMSKILLKEADALDEIVDFIQQITYSPVDAKKKVEEMQGLSKDHATITAKMHLVEDKMQKALAEMAELGC